MPQFAGAHRISGRYEREGAQVKVTIYLTSFAAKGDGFEEIDVGKSVVVTGDDSQPEKLTADILAAADKMVAGLPK